MARKPRESLPLADDARWRPIGAVHRWLMERLGDYKLASLELEQALARGRVRCMVRSISDGKGKLLAPAAWTKLMLYPEIPGKGGVRGVVYRPQPSDPFPGIVTPFGGGAVFGWQPDVEAAWPSAGSVPVDHDDASHAPPPRVKPGPKPTRDWPALLAQWLIEVAADDPHRLQNVDDLVLEARIILRNQIGWAPKDDKDLRAKIVELLRPVRR